MVSESRWQMSLTQKAWFVKPFVSEELALRALSLRRGKKLMWESLFLEDTLPPPKKKEQEKKMMFSLGSVAWVKSASLSPVENKFK